MPDTDGYPTDDELQAILDFKGSAHEFVDYINSIWWHEGFKIEDGKDIIDHPVKRCTISTWGWSGNEDIMGYIDKTWFRLLWWQSSRRGGHYEYEVAEWAWDSKETISGGLPRADSKK